MVLSVNKKFQWLILEKDENPKISKYVLEKFLSHGYDAELGWVRKPNTEHSENGRDGKVKWTTNNSGARTNPKFEEMKSDISCYGDSFSFCRQVNDDETWEHYLSELLKTNVQNFGVGNYGLDQAYLRLKREYSKTIMINKRIIIRDNNQWRVAHWNHKNNHNQTFSHRCG